MASDSITTISLAPETRDRLRNRGSKGETYDAIVSKLLDDSDADS